MELVELVTDYLEGKLSAAEHARFEKHLAECDACTTYLKQIRQTIQLTGHLREETLAPTTRQELLHVFRNWKNSQAS